MNPRQREKAELLAHIDCLLEEAHGLPRSSASWERRQQIDWELIQLFRQIGSLSAGPRPYWSDLDEAEEAERDPGTSDLDRSL